MFVFLYFYEYIPVPPYWFVIKNGDILRKKGSPSEDVRSNAILLTTYKQNRSTTY